MTPRERMFRAIRHEDVDRMPVSTYNLHGFSWSPHRHVAGYARLLGTVAEAGAACLCKVASARARRNGSAVERRTEEKDGSTFTTTTWRTPKGPLTQVDRKPEGQPSMQVKPYLADPSDVEKLLSIGFEPALWDAGPIKAAVAEIGDAGVAYLDYGDPFYRVSDLFDQEDFAIRTLTEPAFIRSLVDFFFEPIFRDLSSLLDALDASHPPLLFYTVGPERATPPLLSPEMFRALVVPSQRRLVEMIHSHGYPVCLHCHGRVRQVLPHILACGYDAIEPAEPPPQGDVDLTGLQAACGGKMAVMGYVQDQDFYLSSEEGVRAHVRSIRELVRGGSGYVCCPTCTPFQFPPSDVYVRNYSAFLSESAQS